MKKNIQLEVLMGLPASGKTTFAKEEAEQNPRQVAVIDVDRIKDELSIFFYSRNSSIRDCIVEGIRKKNISPTVNRIIIDGLFLTNDNVAEAILAAAPYFSQVDVVIHRWNEDRECCVRNDGGRREVSSTNTILHAEYEAIDVEYLQDEIQKLNCQIKGVVEHRVVLKPDWQRFYKQYSVASADGYLRSEKWTSGGLHGNCWDDTKSPIDPEEPLEFDALDEFLEAACPSVSFLHYKKIRKACVSIEEHNEYDYYGGNTIYQNWVCDLEKLYSCLQELGYEFTLP